MRTTKRTKLLNAALEKLADLFEFGQLMADTSPAEFLTTVHDEIVRLRALTAAPAAGRPGDNWLSGQARDIATEQAILPPWKRVPPLEPSVTDRPILCPACDAGEPERCAVSSSHPCCWERAVYDRGHAAGAAQRSRDVVRLLEVLVTVPFYEAERVLAFNGPDTLAEAIVAAYKLCSAAAISAAGDGAGEGDHG